jgi:tRNA nucleotidyltransferase (CCA-adding enzyme)
MPAAESPTTPAPNWRRYEVGGAVRDALLGRPVSDRDWVVVGAKPQDLVSAGFRPVGRDFPVFLHPDTHEEHALARTERKTAPGYHGFVFHAAPEVTLEQDLSRRDLTINAMARGEDGVLVDPYGGVRDLRDRVLRHVSPAFAEDPVRILRLARFAARFPDFTVAPETLALMRAMVAAGEADALVAERVWQELARGLAESRPSRLLAVLDSCGALARLLPPLGRPDPRTARPAAGGPVAPADLGPALDAAAALAATAEARAGLLVAGLAAASPDDAGGTLAPADPPGMDLLARRVEALAAHWRLPTEVRDRAVLAAREADAMAVAAQADAPALGALLDRCDAWRRPQRVRDLVTMARALARGRAAGHGPAGQDAPMPPGSPEVADRGGRRVLAALEAALDVDTAAAARAAVRAGAGGPAIGAAVLASRVQAIDTALQAVTPTGEASAEP